MSRFKAFALGAVALYVVVYVLLLGVRPLVAPDEVRYAEVPREMVESGDWIVPRLNGLVYFEKPVLGYWVTGLSLMVFGDNRFAVRFPFALATGVSALVVLVMVRRSGGGRWPGLLAAVAFLTSAQVFGVGTFAVLDALLAMLLTAAMGTFWLAHIEQDRLRRHALFAAFGVCCGLAFLTKGFLAFVFPVVAIVPFMVWERRFKDILLIPWIPMAAAGAIALPWTIAIAERGTGFWEYFFWEVHLNRFSKGKWAMHSEPVWYYLPFLVGGMLPWIAFAPTAIKASWRRRPWDSFARYTACWFVFPVLFLTLSKGKLGTYVQPCFAPLVIWLVVWMTRSVAGSRRTLNIASIVIAVCAVLIGAGTLVQTLTNVAQLDGIYTASEQWKGYVGTAGFLACAMIAAGGWRARRTALKYAHLAAAAAVLFVTALFVFPARIEVKTPEAWLEQHADRVPADAILVTDGSFVYAVCWVFKRADAYMLPNYDELSYALDREDGKDRALTAADFKAMVRDPARTRAIVLVGREISFGTLLKEMREPHFSETSRGALIAVF